ncbi:transcription activator of gluconeogenesis [Mariannaea sp. PMI_226]|nr:transcription activator of gluconeogenesis [Mariannaea sp. PMI_226]
MPHEMEENGPEVSDVMSENEDEPETFLKDDEKMADQGTAESNTEVKKKYDPKDPLRPRRKKARRACFACQRAHLTCGDERPCQRCIKRGLADACQDGVRKKAKYLHDAPPEALRPVLGPNYNPTPTPTRPNSHRQNSSQSDNMSTSGSTFFQGSTASFPVYSAGSQSSHALPDNISFPTQASPTTFQGPTPNTQAQMNNIMAGNAMDFNALFDPSNPALYNFDLEGLNFGSQYAGWEFGILNKMALGAETPPRENSISQTPTTEASYGALFGNGNGSGYDHAMLGTEFSGLDTNNHSLYAHGNLQHGLPHAYAIAAGPTSLHSPSTDTTASPHSGAGIDGSPGNNNFAGVPPAVPTTHRPRHKLARGAQSILGKRQRDSAAIYESVKEPYPYTAGFHNMVAVLRKRLPGNKLLKIAKALGEIRPSFISCTKDLTRQDLIFMEKCFQRTLVEYDDFLQHCCAPTVVCRRSGEVAAVNKEFTALTGWTKDVLLGKEPNNNVINRSANGTSGQENSSTSEMTTPMTTPRLQNAILDSSGRPQPVFLAELLDDDSVVEFYQDFSQLAFEDSRGKVQRSCRLNKYRTQQSLEVKDLLPQNDPRTGILSSRVTRIDGELGISRIEKDGKVDCTYCWTIKRDVFDIPMMIIINFLPRYYPDQGPQQLAV